MEKTLTIDGQKVRFKSNAATARRYRAQFGNDFFADLLKMMPLMSSLSNGTDFNSLDYDSLNSLSFEVFENMIWVLAKTADKTIPEPLEWLEGFDEMPIMDIMPELQQLMMSSFESANKKKNQVTTTKV